MIISYDFNDELQWFGPKKLNFKLGFKKGIDTVLYKICRHASLWGSFLLGMGGRWGKFISYVTSHVFSYPKI